MLTYNHCMLSLSHDQYANAVKASAALKRMLDCQQVENAKSCHCKTESPSRPWKYNSCLVVLAVAGQPVNLAFPLIVGHKILILLPL